MFYPTRDGFLSSGTDAMFTMAKSSRQSVADRICYVTSGPQQLVACVPVTATRTAISHRSFVLCYKSIANPVCLQDGGIAMSS